VRVKEPPAIPHWMNVINADAYLGANEIAEIFHILPSSITNFIRAGRIPEPDKLCPRMNGKGKPKNKWKLKTVRDFISTQN